MLQRKIVATQALAASLCRAGHMPGARAIRDDFSDMIVQEARDGCNSEGLQLFRRFQSCNLSPDEFVVARVLSLSADLHAPDEGMQIHAFVVKKNLRMDVAASNALINFYHKCGSVGDAENVFDSMCGQDVYTWTAMVSGYALNGHLLKAMEWFNMMPCRNTVSWNSIISGYQRQGYNGMALELFQRMRGQGEAPNKSTFLAVLKACSCLQQLTDGKMVHCYLVRVGWMKSVFVECSLMDMYAKCGDLLDVEKAFSEITGYNIISWSILMAAYAQNGKIVEAEKIFKGMHERNVVSWNVMISSYIHNEKKDEAFALFMEMVKEGISPNCFTFTSLLNGCSENQYPINGKMFHGYVLKTGFQWDTSVGNSLITMYGENGNATDARVVFDTMPCWDIVSWTALMAAYVSNNDMTEAGLIFDRMPQKNHISWNTMMFGYLQYDKITESNFAYGVNNLSAIRFFSEMENSEIKPDHFSYNCALSACAGAGALEQARAIHCRTVRRGFVTDVGVANALISAYGKCGCLREAESVFWSMTSPDMISWNTLLTGYSQNGQGNEALNFYEEMQLSGIEPNHVTFISLLSACSYLGEVEQAWKYFESMKDHGISPTKEHYACMVDLLGRAGRLHEAEVLIRSMPIKPDIATWGALLGACKNHGDAIIGRKAADEIFSLEPNNSPAHTALAETYAAARIWEDVAQVRATKREKMLLKGPGCSWIEVRNHKVIFLSGDTTHRLEDAIYATLWSLYNNMSDRKTATDT